MNKRDEDEHQIDTVPPPPGEDDAYSAETRIGKIPSDLLQAMKRAHASEATLGRAPSLPPDLSGGLAGDRPSSRLTTPGSRASVPRPTVPRVTPTIPPPPETTPASVPGPVPGPIHEGIPSFGLPGFGAAASPKKADAPREISLEDLASDDHDYVGSMLGTGLGAGVVPQDGRASVPQDGRGAALPPPPAVQVAPVVAAVPMFSPAGPGAGAVLPSAPAPVPAPGPVSAPVNGSAGEDALATSSPSRPTPQVVSGEPSLVGTAVVPAVVPVEGPVSEGISSSMPTPGPMRPVTDSQVDEGRMSFAPFMEQSRRLNIILMVSIGFLLLLTVIVLIAAK